MIALEGQVTDVGFGEQWHSTELTLGHAPVEFFAAQDVIEILHAVDFVLALLRRDQQANMVPLAGGLGRVEWLVGLGINRRLVEGIQPATPLWVGGFRVVLELDFRAGGPGGAALIGDVVHDAAVAALRNVVVELQLEPFVLVFSA